MCQPEVSDLLESVYQKFQITIWNHMGKGPFLWNCLAMDIRSQKSLATFKKKTEDISFFK